MERKSINEEKARGVENPARRDTVAETDKALFSFSRASLAQKRREANCISVFGLVQWNRHQGKARTKWRVVRELQDMFPPELTRRRSDVTIKNLAASSPLTEINLGGVLDKNCNKTRKSG